MTTSKNRESKSSQDRKTNTKTEGVDDVKFQASVKAWEGKDEPHYMTILGKFRIQTQFYEEVESRLKAIRHCLREGVAYTPDELVWGDLFGFFGASSPEIVLSLKHLAAQPNSGLKEVRWGTFELVTAK